MNTPATKTLSGDTLIERALAAHADEQEKKRQQAERDEQEKQGREHQRRAECAGRLSDLLRSAGIADAQCADEVWVIGGVGFAARRDAGAPRDTAHTLQAYRRNEDGDLCASFTIHDIAALGAFLSGFNCNVWREATDIPVIRNRFKLPEDAGEALDPKGLDIRLVPVGVGEGEAQPPEAPYRIHIKAPVWLDTLGEREIKAITAALRARWGGAAKGGAR